VDLSPTKGRRLLLYSAHGINHSIIATTARIAAVVNTSLRKTLKEID
jgi:hypothetical protein